MRILVVSPSLPVPLNSGGSIRVFNLVRHLSATDEIDFMALDDGSTPEHEVRALRKYCSRVDVIVPKKRSLAETACRVSGNIVRGHPFYTKYVDYPEFRSQIRDRVRMTRYDILHFEHSHLAGLLDGVERGEGVKTVLSTHNVAFDQFLRMAHFEQNPVTKLKLLMTALPMRKWEPLKAAAFDSIIAVCERDRQLLLAENSALDITVVPNGVDTEANRPFPRQGRTENILIVGSMDYQPNADAVRYFLERIFPIIREQMPQCTLTVVGKNPPESLRKIHAPPVVRICPDVSDVKPYYAQALVSIVALRSGGGSRLKILEALALGTPVVSTRVGCEGLDVQDRRDIMIADDPDEFAGHVIALIRDPMLWSTLAGQGARLVQDRYDWRQIAGQLRTHYQRWVGQSVPGMPARSPCCKTPLISKEITRKTKEGHI